MMSLTRGLQSLQKQVDVQTNVEIPSAALTLTRSATLAITTAGTIITWQTETRNQGFTWSGTAITIPTDGYYAISLVYTSATNHSAFGSISVGGVFTAIMAGQSGSAFVHGYIQMGYYTTGDVVRLTVTPSVNVTINQNAQSPFLHIVQLTGAK